MRVAFVAAAAVLAASALTAPPTTGSIGLAAGPAPAVRRASHLPWSSGVVPQAPLARHVIRFASGRGRAVDNVGVFPSRDSWPAMHSTWWTSALPHSFRPARDDLVVAVPLWPETRSVRRTGTARQWRSLGAVFRGVDPDTYLRLAPEMNIDTYWALRPGNRRAWITAYRRAARLLVDGCPRCRIVWNPNVGGDQTGTSSRTAFLAVRRLVDDYGIDSYDVFPSARTRAGVRTHLRDRGRLEESYRFARRHGKEFAVPEWGIACGDAAACQWRGEAGGDDPRYVRAYADWFARHARHLAFESYYDEPAPFLRSALHRHPVGPRSGAAYRSRLAAYAGPRPS